MGFPGNPAHPQLQAPIVDRIARIFKAGKAPGIPATSKDQARHWLQAGALFVAVGIDTMLLTAAASALQEQFKPSRVAGATVGGY